MKLIVQNLSNYDHSDFNSNYVRRIEKIQPIKIENNSLRQEVNYSDCVLQYFNNLSIT